MELTPFFFGLYKFVKYGLYPLTWVVLLLGIATLLALFPFSPRRLRWVRRLLMSSLLLLVALSSPLVATPLIGLLESWHPPTTDTLRSLRCHRRIRGRHQRERLASANHRALFLFQKSNHLRRDSLSARLCPHVGPDRG